MKIIKRLISILVVIALIIIMLCTGTTTVSTNVVNAAGTDPIPYEICGGCDVLEVFNPTDTLIIENISILAVVPAMTPTDFVLDLEVSYGATWTINGSADKRIHLDGNAYYNITVFAGDGINYKRYLLNLVRNWSLNANLSNITLGDGNLTPAFSPNITEYTVDVDSTTETIDISATKEDLRSSIYRVNGVYNESANWTSQICNLNLGENKIEIVVKSEKGDTKMYKVIVNRGSALNITFKPIPTVEPTPPPKSSACELLAIYCPIEQISINEGGISGVRPSEYQYQYDFKVSRGATWTKTENSSWNAACIKVTAEDGKTSKVYNVHFDPAWYSEAFLSDISFNNVIISPTFSPDISMYTVTVDNTIEKLGLNISMGYQYCMRLIHFSINDKYYSHDTEDYRNYYCDIKTSDLNFGDNEIVTTVQSESGGVIKTYKIKITKVLSQTTPTPPPQPTQTLAPTAPPTPTPTPLVTQNGEYQYELIDNGTNVSITGYIGSSGDINLPNEINGKTVTTIANGAFSNCSNIMSITIPNSITTINQISCTNLTAIYVAADNADYSSSDGVLFNKDKTELIKYPEKKSDTTYIVPNSVTTIEQSAINNCSNLTTITIPDSVTFMWYTVFWNSNSLSSINVDLNNVNYSSIDGVLFNKDKTELREYPPARTASTYIVPNSVTSIAGYAFDYCSSITAITVGNKVTNIGDCSFIGCTSLTKIIIPHNVTYIGDAVFRYCSNLIIYVESGSCAEQYANTYHIPFVATDGGFYTTSPPPTPTATLVQTQPPVTATPPPVTQTPPPVIQTSPPTATPTLTPTATVTPIETPITFPDVNPDNFGWAQESVEYLAGLNIINGLVVDGQLMYLPANTITRAELCKLIVAAYGFTQDGQAMTFTDIDGHWAVDYIAIASSQGIVKGYEDNTFKPDSGISREELAVMISRAMSKKNVGTQIADADIEQNLTIFQDQGMIDTWARKDVAFAVLNGIIKGSPVEGGGFNFLPLDTANRAETAVMIKRAYDKLN